MTKRVFGAFAAAVMGLLVVVTQMSIMDTPTGGYQSTVLLENVRKYMEKARTVYNQRPLGSFGNPTAPRR